MCEGISSACTAKLLYPTPDSALLDACEAMFALNRHAKRAVVYRDRIYEAKNELIRKLVARGYLVGLGKHSVRLSGQECFACDGEGCYRCDHTGYWRDSTMRKYHVLRFAVGDRTYTGHQPIDDVDYALPPAPEIDDAGDWDPREQKAVPAIDDVGTAIAMVNYAATDGDAMAQPGELHLSEHERAAGRADQIEAT